MMQRTIVAGLASLAVLAGCGWAMQSVLFPAVVRAYTARSEVFIDFVPTESYDALIRRADAAARAGVQRLFDRDILATSAYVIVTVQHNGTAAPVMAIDVERTNWRNRPDPRIWATYFRSTIVLLNLPVVRPPSSTPKPAPTASPSPAAAPATPTAPALPTLPPPTPSNPNLPTP